MKPTGSPIASALNFIPLESSLRGLSLSRQGLKTPVGRSDDRTVGRSRKPDRPFCDDLD
ncbi:MAG: hypothetical protein JGK17_07315 [Microcoleus sp. PH2017_10_PVI_O_A]|uniref:hypothetical protein n=1 Tax=unclassified Microcoleus TaxID=2642155 RepID=UPI001D4D34D8|nr:MULTISPECIES: hypothetical protein [unclassified Microcoleus]MCC3405393.1 hypothetical protein [Microcoleus sp. PH2017_10_PVI_O_A]MCC3463962.1 hypothetical protein [Microcoleus sp. PH2017_11_PCY_U_A]MCC3482287.1 hypothetical protein [Microcoleus sp. PH2017_12_PCY_D_A]MCC3532130.1 hypothetical protein [Microcoleus sp. PH2017_21_RUC_O_A]MCC3544432.1 hypothetical protein [Microcoleus sp. PH2017_22_RUC_O_B]